MPKPTKHWSSVETREPERPTSACWRSPPLWAASPTAPAAGCPGGCPQSPHSDAPPGSRGQCPLGAAPWGQTDRFLTPPPNLPKPVSHVSELTLLTLLCRGHSRSRLPRRLQVCQSVAQTYRPHWQVSEAAKGHGWSPKPSNTRPRKCPMCTAPCVWTPQSTPRKAILSLHPPNRPSKSPGRTRAHAPPEEAVYPDRAQEQKGHLVAENFRLPCQCHSM